LTIGARHVLDAAEYAKELAREDQIVPIERHRIDGRCRSVDKLDVAVAAFGSREARDAVFGRNGRQLLRAFAFETRSTVGEQSRRACFRRVRSEFWSIRVFHAPVL